MTWTATEISVQHIDCSQNVLDLDLDLYMLFRADSYV